ncbi:MAG: glycosyltransferase family 4 protein [Lachnospiraceae bacterium]|nr:glycosyltransferase family 4 protein [Lachnospiraceae bacterium]MCI1422736.1 glycosyltransferase family 4 protein [Lachnospiraceae bacterium]MCI1452660.1 glycosyltransferase family 4 protein [Lachnospiraceae bacterium]
MDVTFVSNYINHHQIPFCNAMAERTGNRFLFIETEEMDSERQKMGWKRERPPYVIRLSEEPERAKEAILGSTVLLAGWAPEAEDLVTKRLLTTDLLTFRVSERLYKDGQWRAISPRGLAAKYRQYTRFAKKPYYLLSAGGYVGSDFRIIHAFPEKKLRWGYFPPCRHYAPGALQKIKAGSRKGDVPELIWAGRFVDFKHPEQVLRLAADLKRGGEHFHLTIAGGGEGEEAARKTLKEEGLEQEVTLLGLTDPDTVREKMERADIHLFTSDAGEGWGAVVNEAMNSGCAVLAGNEAGAVPFLIQNGENGLVYESRSYEQLLAETRRLLHDEALVRRLGENAEKTITGLWNAEHAADALLTVSEGILEGAGLAKAPAEGPASVDPCEKPFVRV